MLDEAVLFLYKVVLAVLPFVSTFILGYMAFKMWLHYIRQDFISGIQYVVLEVVPPREVERSPKAMELFLTNALYHFSNKGGKEQYWQGAVWFWHSLEIVSIEGQVHFFIRTPSRLKEYIETQMYAQYPQAQVRVAEDYTLAVDDVSENGSWKAWGCEFGLLKPEAFPIKTYVDFGLDKDPDEEFKVDPISPLIEFFGSLQKGEQGWFQIVITPAKKEYHTAGTWFGHHNWVDESKVQLFKFLRPYTSTRESADEPGHYGIEIRTPGHLADVQSAIVAKTAKLGFETGIRVVYVAKKEAFNISNRRNIRMILRQYGRPDYNEFNRINSTQADALGSSFWSLSPKQVSVLASRVVHEYQERSFFHLSLRHHLISDHSLPWIIKSALKRFFLPYFHHQTYVLNVEEIATLWHFPGQILKVPTLERIESKEASPPTNLPT